MTYPKNLTQMLAFQLEGMYETEKRIQKELPELIQCVNTLAVKKAAVNYLESVTDKRLKLKRAFSYLLTGPFGRKSKASATLIKEALDAGHTIRPLLIREAIIVSSLSGLIQYKINNYCEANRMAMRLGLQQVVELLDSVIAWEKESARTLAAISSIQVNRIEPLVPTVK